MAPTPTTQNEIIGLLARYGVVSSNAIAQLLSKKMRRDTLLTLLKNMDAKGTICRVSQFQGGSPSSYWMLPSEHSIKTKVAQASGIEIKYFRNKKTRYAIGDHETLCTFFQASVERQMPSVLTLREATGNYKELPDHLMTDDVKRNGYVPDICLGIPLSTSDFSANRKIYRWVAVEVDRSYRTSKRISQRMNVYTRHTNFSGVLYLLPSSGMVNPLNQIFEYRGAKSGLNASRNSLSFMAAAKAPSSLVDLDSFTVWCGQHEIKLTEWLAIIALKEVHERDGAMLRITQQAGVNEKN